MGGPSQDFRAGLKIMSPLEGQTISFLLPSVVVEQPDLACPLSLDGQQYSSPPWRPGVRADTATTVAVINPTTTREPRPGAELV